MKKILFLYPPSTYVNHSMYKHFTYFAETIDVVSRYFDNIEVMDCAVNSYTQKEIFNSFKKTDYIVMEIEAYNIETSISLANLYKAFNPNGKIIVYGTACTIMPNHLKSKMIFDYIISHGCYAEAVLSVLGNLSEFDYPFDKKSNYYYLKDNEYKFSEGHFQLPNDQWGIATDKFVPLDKYRKLNDERFELTVQTGCPYNCNFCSEKILFNSKCGTKYRNIEEILKVIKEIKPKFKEIYFCGTTLTVNRKWITELCNALIENNSIFPWRTVTRIDCVDKELLELMKKSGNIKISFGIETFDNDVLTSINKKQEIEKVVEVLDLCKEVGIKAKALLMLGIPGQTLESINNTINLLKKYNIDYRFKEYSPIIEAYTLDSNNESVEHFIPNFDRSAYRHNSIEGLSSEEYMNLLFPTNYVR